MRIDIKDLKVNKVYLEVPVALFQSSRELWNHPPSNLHLTVVKEAKEAG